ncbi:restriction endonuclease [Klebsiella pneumoniae]|uniref:restriction endonuclease n=1 Tax=Klebsiella pneumoniae TaxID=573 RepID=UPI001E2FFF40|nr:restriction endonuclease [Klebsiella pneumoniae]
MAGLSPPLTTRVRGFGPVFYGTGSMDILSLFPSNVIALWAVSFAFLAVLYWWKITARKRRHKRKQQQARRVLAKIQTLPAFGYKIAYLRKIDPFTFEELLLEGFKSHGFRTIRNKRYTGDGGIDGQVIIGKHRYLIQAKRYRGHIALQHVQEFDTLLKQHNCRGLFCHTGKTGAASKAVSFASERMEIISGQRLIDLLTPGSSFTIATAPQTMMRRTAATRGTNIIVEEADKNTTDSMRVN